MTFQDTILIEFGGDTDHIAVAGFDADLNVDLEGEVVTSFGPNESVGLWLHLSSNVKVDEVRVTDGSILNYDKTSLKHTAGARTKTIQHTFTSIDDTVTDGKQDKLSSITFDVIPSSFALEYPYGNKGGPTAYEESLGVIKLVAEDVENIPYIVDMTVNFAVSLFTLQTPDVDLDEDGSYPLTIVFYISEI